MFRTLESQIGQVVLMKLSYILKQHDATIPSVHSVFLWLRRSTNQYLFPLNLIMMTEIKESVRFFLSFQVYLLDIFIIYNLVKKLEYSLPIFKSAVKTILNKKETKIIFVETNIFSFTDGRKCINFFSFYRTLILLQYSLIISFFLVIKFRTVRGCFTAILFLTIISLIIFL